VTEDTTKEEKDKFQEFLASARAMLKAGQELMEPGTAESTFRNSVRSTLVGAMEDEDVEDFLDLIFDDEAELEEVWTYREYLQDKYKETQ
jgi:hypothetical protein